jgi:4-carboxymuconolactone decarboxylase
MKALFAFAFALASVAAYAEERFRVLSQDELTPEQTKLVQSLLAGPRGAGAEPTPEAVKRLLERGPFNAWMRSPELGDRLQRVGEYVRFNTSLPLRLNEFAILITARHWSSQYEWYAHEPLATKAGLDPKIAAQLAAGKRPSGMKDDEALVYDFSTQLHRNKNVSDATYKRAVALLGEKGVMDLIGVNGYYSAVSMTLNVAQVPIPGGAQNPLKPLK